MTPTAAPPARRFAATLLAAGAVASALAGCGGKDGGHADDARVSELGREVAQLSAQVKAQDRRIAQLGTGGPAVPLAASTQSGPGNTVVAQCPPGSFLFRLPRTPQEGGEALCRPLAAPAGAEITPH